MANDKGEQTAKSKPQKAEDPANKFLPSSVRDHYEVINWFGGSRQTFGRKFGTVDLETMTISRAAGLVARGFTKIKKREK